MISMEITRRSALLGVGAVGSLAGCTGSIFSENGTSVPFGSSGDSDEVEVLKGQSDGDIGDRPTGNPPFDHPPVASDRYHLAWDREDISSSVVSGGVGQDGIPSIDAPRFQSPEDATVENGEPIFGVVKNGVARAYPQKILVWHEIVNDVIGGEPVSITYCPLTGTSQGFDRGASEFGVSGRLVNSNLVMYNRTHDDWWSQVLATGINGPGGGYSLREFRVYWTTWGEWKSAQPNTEILAEVADSLRPYGSDPYGEYNPVGGYYSDDGLLFSPLEQDDDIEHPKTVVIGARTSDAAIAFRKELLLNRRVLQGPLGNNHAVAVADDTLSTGYIYQTDEPVSVEAIENEYLVDGEMYSPVELPFPRVLAMDAMWFAWYGFYPTTTYVH